MTRSLNPYTLSLCFIESIKLCRSCTNKGVSGCNKTRVPPCRSRPFFMFVLGALKTLIPTSWVPLIISFVFGTSIIFLIVLLVSTIVPLTVSFTVIISKIVFLIVSFNSIISMSGLVISL